MVRWCIFVCPGLPVADFDPSGGPRPSLGSPGFWRSEKERNRLEPSARHVVEARAAVPQRTGLPATHACRGDLESTRAKDSVEREDGYVSQDSNNSICMCGGRYPGVSGIRAAIYE
jgi:hypothetical protein